MLFYQWFTQIYIDNISYKRYVGIKVIVYLTMILVFHNSGIDNEKILSAINLKNKRGYIIPYNHLVFILSNTSKLT